MGKASSVDPEKFTFSDCQVYAQLYDRVKPELTVLVIDETKKHDQERLKRNLKRPLFAVTEPLMQKVELMYNAACAEYKKFGLHGHEKAVNVLMSGDYEKLRCVIMFHRFVMNIEAVKSDGFLVQKAQVVDQFLHLEQCNESPAQTSLELFRTGSNYIGRPHTVALPNPAGLGTLMVLINNRTGVVSMTSVIFDTGNAFRGQDYVDIKKGLRNIERAERAEKRVIGPPGFLAAVAAIKLEINELIDSMGDTDVNDSNNLDTNKKVWKKLQALVFLGFMVTCPNRGRETVCRSQADVTEEVQGNDHFMLICRVLMDPNALPRTVYYMLLHFHSKHLNGTSENRQQNVPKMASVFSATDILLYAFTMMVGMQPSILSARANPTMRMFMPFEEGNEDIEQSGNDEDDEDNANHQVGQPDVQQHEDVVAARSFPASTLCQSVKEVTMSSMNDQLRKDVPDTILHDFFITGYSGRTGFAVLFEMLGIHRFPELCAWVRTWYGHSILSWQYRKYGVAGGRIKYCTDCQHLDTSNGCSCQVSRTHCKRAKKSA